MRKKPSIYEKSKRVAAYADLAQRSTVSLGKWYDVNRRTKCALCRREQRSVKSFSKDKQTCLSCKMRWGKPRWVHLDGLLGKWRVSSGADIDEFAEICGWGHNRQHFLEYQPRVNCKTATELARAFLVLARRGYDIEQVIREWPLFVVLVPADVLEQEPGAEQDDTALGQEELDGGVHEERRPDPDGSDGQGS